MSFRGDISAGVTIPTNFGRDVNPILNLLDPDGFSARREGYSVGNFNRTPTGRELRIPVSGPASINEDRTLQMRLLAILGGTKGKRAEGDKTFLHKNKARAGTRGDPIPPEVRNRRAEVSVAPNTIVVPVDGIVKVRGSLNTFNFQNRPQPLWGRFNVSGNPVAGFGNVVRGLTSWNMEVNYRYASQKAGQTSNFSIACFVGDGRTLTAEQVSARDYDAVGSQPISLTYAAAGGNQGGASGQSGPSGQQQTTQTNNVALKVGESTLLIYPDEDALSFGNPSTADIVDIADLEDGVHLGITARAVGTTTIAVTETDSGNAVENVTVTVTAATQDSLLKVGIRNLPTEIKYGTPPFVVGHELQGSDVGDVLSPSFSCTKGRLESNPWNTSLADNPPIGLGSTYFEVPNLVGEKASDETMTFGMTTGGQDRTTTQAYRLVPSDDELTLASSGVPSAGLVAGKSANFTFTASGSLVDSLAADSNTLSFFFDQSLGTDPADVTGTRTAAQTVSFTAPDVDVDTDVNVDAKVVVVDSDGDPVLVKRLVVTYQAKAKTLNFALIPATAYGVKKEGAAPVEVSLSPSGTATGAVTDESWDVTVGGLSATRPTAVPSTNTLEAKTAWLAYPVNIAEQQEGQIIGRGTRDGVASLVEEAIIVQPYQFELTPPSIADTDDGSLFSIGNLNALTTTDLPAGRNTTWTVTVDYGKVGDGTGLAADAKLPDSATGTFTTTNGTLPIRLDLPGGTKDDRTVSLSVSASSVYTPTGGFTVTKESSVEVSFVVRKVVVPLTLGVTVPDFEVDEGTTTVLRYEKTGNTVGDIGGVWLGSEGRLSVNPDGSDASNIAEDILAYYVADTYADNVDHTDSVVLILSQQGLVRFARATVTIKAVQERVAAFAPAQFSLAQRDSRSVTINVDSFPANTTSWSYRHATSESGLAAAIVHTVPLATKSVNVENLNTLDSFYVQLQANTTAAGFSDSLWSDSQNVTVERILGQLGATLANTFDGNVFAIERNTLPPDSDGWEYRWATSQAGLATAPIIAVAGAMTDIARVSSTSGTTVYVQVRSTSTDPLFAEGIWSQTYSLLLRVRSVQVTNFVRLSQVYDQNNQALRPTRADRFRGLAQVILSNQVTSMPRNAYWEIPAAWFEPPNNRVPVRIGANIGGRSGIAFRGGDGTLALGTRQTYIWGVSLEAAATAFPIGNRVVVAGKRIYMVCRQGSNTWRYMFPRRWYADHSFYDDPVWYRTGRSGVVVRMGNLTSTFRPDEVLGTLPSAARSATTSNPLEISFELADAPTNAYALETTSTVRQVRTRSISNVGGPHDTAIATPTLPEGATSWAMRLTLEAGSSSIAMENPGNYLEFLRLTNGRHITANGNNTILLSNTRQTELPAPFTGTNRLIGIKHWFQFAAMREGYHTEWGPRVEVVPRFSE